MMSRIVFITRSGFARCSAAALMACWVSALQAGTVDSTQGATSFISEKHACISTLLNHINAAQKVGVVSVSIGECRCGTNRQIMSESHAIHEGSQYKKETGRSMSAGDNIRYYFCSANARIETDETTSTKLMAAQASQANVGNSAASKTDPKLSPETQDPQAKGFRLTLDGLSFRGKNSCFARIRPHYKTIRAQLPAVKFDALPKKHLIARGQLTKYGYGKQYRRETGKQLSEKRKIRYHSCSLSADVTFPASEPTKAK
jgi:hypothetical protein